MSVIPVTPDLIEVTTLLLQPSQSFASSSSGLTGSIRLATKPTNFIKNISTSGDGSYFTETFGITADSDLLYAASTAYAAGTTDISSLIQAYIDEVQTSEIENSQFSTVYPRAFFSPGSVEQYSYSAGEADVPFDSSEWKNNQRRVVKNILIPEQRVENSLSFYGYVNYSCLNFVSSSNFGTGSSIIYPNFSGSDGSRDYSMSGPFTLDFFIKPKAPLDEIESYNAGTIFQISSSICVSLISGSQLSPDRRPETYRILLQLSQSADISPSKISVGSLPLSYPNDLIFATDETLKRDCWHRVTIRWGTNSRSYGTGSIQIDEIATQFVVDKETIQSDSAFTSSDALILGNYYNSGDRIGKFFNTTDATYYGTEVDPAASTTLPAGFEFANPLNAELHHISLFNRYLSDSELESINSLYSESAEDDGPSFFVAPFFTSSVPDYYAYRSPTDLDVIGSGAPIKNLLAAGYNCNFLNLQNFIIDFSQKNQPRPYGMTPVPGESTLTLTDSRTESVDDIMMTLMSNRRRNFTIIPCDDGNFEPDFSILESDDTRFQDFDSYRIPSMISMDQLIPSGFYILGAQFDSGLSYDGTDYPYLPLFQNVNYLTTNRTNSLTKDLQDAVDRSSNIVTIFSIPAAYYLNRIIPGTFVITDSSVSGSGGMSFTLRDDGRGNLYRCDTRTTPAAWNRVGAIFYPQGIAAIISPHLPFFGKNSFEMSFRGEVRKSVVSYTIPASPAQINSSFNQTYKQFSPTNLRSETADEFVYIDGINLHDKNLNVVMRAKLAQPVQKREGDELVFRLRYDF